MNLHLPTLNACLNGLSTLLLISGFLAIRRGRRDLHKRLMLGAVASSLLFLVSYLTHHYLHGSTPYRGAGRTLYLVVLATHTVLAASLVYFVPVTLARAFRGQFERHRKLARFTLLVWLYVSVTGIEVYLALYV